LLTMVPKSPPSPFGLINTNPDGVTVMLVVADVQPFAEAVNVTVLPSALGNAWMKNVGKPDPSSP
jgi:hypothetical protein